MNNRTLVNGWLGTGVVDLMRLGGTATARPRPGHTVVFGDEFSVALRPEVQQQA